jgi:hypothetical protein
MRARDYSLCDRINLAISCARVSLPNDGGYDLRFEVVDCGM